MRYPKKVYVNCDPFGFLHAYATSNHPPKVEEYIRKDWLLKILKESPDLDHDRFDPMWLEGRNFLREQLIDKLKSV